MAAFSKASTFTREVAMRIFAEELRSSSITFRDSDDQYAPLYLLTPTGARCNRLFLVATLTEKDQIGEEAEYWRGRVVDPTGSVFVYAGQYQPEAAQILARIEPPAFVAVVGKPNLYETEDGNIIVSIRAESIQRVGAATRDRWIIDAARHTLKRLQRLMDSGSGSETAGKDDDVQKALLHYKTDAGRYRQMAIAALESLKAERMGAGPAAFKPADEEEPYPSRVIMDEMEDIEDIEEIDFTRRSEKFI
jgi:hypothetical protein